MIGATCTHRWIIEPPPSMKGTCKKCGATRQFSNIRYDSKVTAIRYDAPKPSPKEKVLRYLRNRHGQSIDWNKLMKTSGVGYRKLGQIVEELKTTGAVLEGPPLTYYVVGVD